MSNLQKCYTNGIMNYQTSTPAFDILNINKGQKARIDNYNNQSKISSTFSNNQWLGLASSIAPSAIPNKYAVNCLNVNSNYSYIESPLGYTLAGNHIGGDLDNFEDWQGLIAGEFDFEQYTGENAELELSNSQYRQIDKGLFKIIKNKTTNTTVFYWLNKEGHWEKKQPYKNYYLETGQVNTLKDTLEEYNFIGSNFNYIVWKNTLYICSGEEQFRSSRGKLNGLMKWDGVNWDSIDTGMAGSLKQNTNYIDQQIFDNDPNSTNYNGQFYQYNDSDFVYNPSLIQIYKDRLIIAGAKSNRLQVKLSEWNNPDNFVDNVLGYTNKPLTTADSARPSSFIIPNGSNQINSLNIFNDQVYIGTNKAFYIYQLVQQNIGGNVQFQLDALQTNNITNSGSINQRSVINHQNQLYFISDYQTIPEFSSFKSTSNKTAPIYYKNSSIIDSTMNNLDFSDATLGIYSDKILIGCKSQDISEFNNITILATPFVQSEVNTEWSFVLLDYIQPTHFFQNNRGCYFLNSLDGELYKITASKLGVESKNKDSQGQNLLSTQIPYSVWQTGWTGYDLKKHTATSTKKLEEFVISGYFSSGTKLFITLILDKDSSNYDVNANTGNVEKTFLHEFKDDTEDKKYDTLWQSNENIVDVDIKYRNNAKYYVARFNFAHGINNVQYKKLSVRLVVEDSRYFMIEQFYGVVKDVEANNNDVLEVRWV